MSLMNKSLDEILAEITADQKIDAREAAMLRERLFADGKIDREEAELLFRINDAVSGQANDPAWAQLFVQAIASHVLGDETSPGVLDAEEEKYLMAKIEGDGKVDDAERALLVRIVEKARSTSDTFQKFVLATLKRSILVDGVIDAEEVDMIRTVVYGAGGGGSSGIDRAEADFLFELNTATSGKPNHASWQQLFVDAISKHVLEDIDSPGAISDEEAAWLVERIEGDGKLDDNERAVLTRVRSTVKAIPSRLGVQLARIDS